jgi:hypothetical protein
MRLDKELWFVYQRFVCALKGHEFKHSAVGRIQIVYCERCNWYGGPSGMGSPTQDAESENGRVSVP